MSKAVRKKSKAGKRVSGKRRLPVKRIKRQAKSPAPMQIKKQAFVSEEVVIEKEKFSRPQALFSAPQAFKEELPLGYDKDTLALQVRDPHWLHAYWELQYSAIERLQDSLKERFHGARLILRVYDVSQRIFNGANAHSFFDIDIADHLGNWYIEVSPDKSWCVELGFKLRDGTFIRLLRSNTVHTPSEGPSWITDEEWMIAESDFARLYGMGFGFGKSSPVGKNWQKRLKAMLINRDVSSRRISS